MSTSKVNLTEVRTNWALAKSAELAEQGINNAVIVLPAFDEDGTPMDTAVTETGSKGWGWVQLFQQSSNYDWKQGAIYDNNRWSILRASAKSLDAKFKPGQVLTGNILLIDTLIAPNPGNLSQDLRYTRREIYDMVAQGNTSAIPCKIGDSPIYRVRRWEPTGTERDSTIEHTNQAEIDAWFTSTTKSMNTANSAAIKAAGQAVLNGQK